MKVAFVTNLPTHFHRRLFETIGEHFDTDFFFFSDGNEPWIERRNSQRFGNYKGRYVRGIRLTSRLRINLGLIVSLFRGRYEIFIQSINGRFEILATYIIARILRKPFILWTNLWLHPQTFFHKLTFPITRYVYRNSDAIVAYGYHIRDFLVKLGVDERKIFYSWNVIDNQQFNKRVPEATLVGLREQHKLEERHLVLFVGRVTEEKGLTYLLEAFTTLPPELSASLIVVGSGSERDRLVQLERDRLSNNVFFVDYIQNEELVAYYALADVLVLPSITTKTWKEPWGIVLNEAMNQGCPVIATDAVGAAVGGLVEEGKNGLIVPEKDADAIRSAIIRILSDDKELARMKAYTKESIKSWDQMKSFEGFRSAISYVTSSARAVQPAT